MRNYSRIPVDYMVGGVKRYIEDGIPPGSFLTALFSNDLKGAYRCADEDNTAHMREWVIFMVNEMPWNSQGSEAEVTEWINTGGLRGQQAPAAARDEP